MSFDASLHIIFLKPLNDLHAFDTKGTHSLLFYRMLNEGMLRIFGCVQSINMTASDNTDGVILASYHHTTLNLTSVYNK